MIWAISMVKDEIDIVAATVGRMCEQVDRVLVADNGSTDGTREILTGLDIELVDDPEPAYYQSQKMTALADHARRAGAEWIVPFDADEFWLTTDGRRIAEVLDELPSETMIAEAAVIDHIAVGDGLSPWRRVGVLELPKVACRARRGLSIAQGNHDAGYESIPRARRARGLLEVRHFPYRSPEQFIRKATNGAAAYAATDLPRSTGQHWREYGELIALGGEQAGRDWFMRHFFADDPDNDPTLVFDPLP